MTITTVAADTAPVPDEMSKPARRSKTTPAGVDAALVGRLVAQAREQGLQLSGEGGLLQQLTKIVLESALEGEISDHLGHDKHARSARTAATPATDDRRGQRPNA
jgi:putative transposase